jgi:acetyl-CoA synthetase
MSNPGNPIEALLAEKRSFPPSEEFRSQAIVKDTTIYEKARKDPEAFWAQAAESLTWFQKWDKVLEWNPPLAKWFVGGKINVSVNCLDRHVTSWRRNKAALIWEGEPGEELVLTYGDLYREVNKFANVLKKMGIGKGDRVTVYMPVVPELPIPPLPAPESVPPQRGLRRVQRESCATALTMPSQNW